MKGLAAFFAFVLALMLNPTLATSAEFTPLGFATSTQFIETHLTVSDDGALVVGTANSIYAGPSKGDSSYVNLVRWTQAVGPLVILEDVIGADVSDDGSTIATTTIVRDSTGEFVDTQAVRIFGDVQQVLEGFKVASNVSADGKVLVVFNGNAHFRWTEEGFEQLSVPVTVPNTRIVADISADGAIGVGYGVPGISPFLLSEVNEFVELIGIKNNTHTYALGLSSDGSWIVGRENSGNEVTSLRALRWNVDLEPERLLPENLAWGSAAKDVTHDGRLATGRLYLSDTRLEGRQDIAAGIWTEESGKMEPLQDLLVSHYGLGDSLDGYHLTGVYDVTDDGRFMVGHMINPDGLDEAFLVDLGLKGDFNGDETRDINDLNAISAAIRDSEPNLTFDLDYSNTVDADDQRLWVKQLKNTYFGDANLDGEFNSTDLVAVFEAGQYEDNVAGDSGWATGDWNGDAEFNTSDLVLAFQDGGYEQGPRGAVAVVPEPTSTWQCLTGVLLLTRCRRRRFLL